MDRSGLREGYLLPRACGRLPRFGLRDGGHQRMHSTPSPSGRRIMDAAEDAHLVVLRRLAEREREAARVGSRSASPLVCPFSAFARPANSRCRPCLIGHCLTYSLQSGIGVPSAAAVQVPGLCTCGYEAPFAN